MPQKLHAILSIHDVAPHTLDNVRTLLARIPAPCHQGLSLLVIPGLNWQATDIDTLRQWQQQGYRLCGHGWQHKARDIRGWYHHLHSRCISRDAAEHLSLNQAEIVDLLQNNYQWFIHHNLVPPDCYVPPAWALGSIATHQLSAQPFRFYESTSGYYDCHTKIFRKLPLMGFEADNKWRQYSLAIWNQCNALASRPSRPLRISIHPNDHQLQLAESMQHWLTKVHQCYDYRDIFPQ